MVDSVAVLSDIHGVLPALEAVLAEPEVRSAQRIVLSGDIAAGPQPVAVLDRLVGLGDRALWLRGNADRELVELARGGGIEIPDPIAPWAAAQLRPEQVDRLARLPYPVIEPVAGFGPVLFCHGTPRDDEEVVLVHTRLSRWAEVLATVPEEVRTVVCGHTHMPFLRLVDGRQVINPGSVGMPYGRPGAHWALLRDGAVTLRRTLLDPGAAAAAIRAGSAYPEIERWIESYVLDCAGDVEAIRAFGPRDGRRADDVGGRA